jgi:alpha-tubulin suppressor-like RCC1 family protein
MRSPATPWTLLATLVGLAALGCAGDTPTAAGPGEALTPGTGPAPADQAAPLQFSQLSAGANHTCGVALDGRAYCWGINLAGQIGNGLTGDNPSRPTLVATTLRFRQVSAGYGHTCGVTTTDQAYCWGDNSGGQLGDKTTRPRPTPVKVAGGHSFRDVRAGFAFTCGVTTAGEAYCWGSNSFGQIGDNSIITRLVPRLVRGGLVFRRVVPGSEHACGVSTGDKAYCWGKNTWGQLGDGTRTDRRLPTAVFGNRHWKNVSGSNSHSCGFTTGGAVFCWGLNNEGQLGDGSTTTRPKPTLAKTTGALDGVSPGGGHSCALQADGHALCWGANSFGQVGSVSDATPQLLPTLVVGPGNYDLITAGGQHTCTLTNEQYAVCWGHNNWGQLGRGFYSSKEPVPEGIAAPL